MIFIIYMVGWLFNWWDFSWFWLIAAILLETAMSSGQGYE